MYVFPLPVYPYANIQPLYPFDTPFNTCNDEFIVIDKGGSFGKNILSNLNFQISKSFSIFIAFLSFYISYIKVYSLDGGHIHK